MREERRKEKEREIEREIEKNQIMGEITHLYAGSLVRFCAWCACLMHDQFILFMSQN